MERELVRPGILKEITTRHGFHFTKSLGQNFLVDKNILNKIIEAADLRPDDIVIEVGTGIGTLTKELAKRVEKVYAVEIDRKLIPIVEETTAECRNISLINRDFLEVELDELIEERGRKVKVIANIPYYITTPIIMKCLESDIFVEMLLLMIQKEVADRLTAKVSTKDYGSLSVAVQYYADVEFVGKVSKSSFYPVPKVDSGIVKIEKREMRGMEIEDKKLFFQVVRGSFAKRRKTILNSLTGYVESFDKKTIEKALEQVNIDARRRGESLNIWEFARLSNEIKKIIAGKQGENDEDFN